MVTFKPPELKDRIAAALDSLAEVGESDFFTLDDSFDPAEYVDREVTEDTDFGFTLYNALEPADTTVREVLWWAECLEKGRAVDRTTVVVPGQTIFYVTPSSNNAQALVFVGEVGIADLGLTAAGRVDDTRCSVSLVQKFTPFNLFAEKEFECDSKICPSYGEHDVVAVVSHEGELPVDKARELCCAYLFELAAGHDLTFGISEFPRAVDLYYDDDFEIPEEEGHRQRLAIRPLDRSRGMSQLHDLYLQGANSNSEEWAFVSFAKVIEFVSVTVVRRTAHEEVRARLMAPGTLRPDAPFIDSLIGLVERQREYRKQREAIRHTLQDCCDLAQVATLLPPYLGGPIEGSPETKQHKALMTDLSDAIVDTRNRLVHAKPAYESRGKECPDAELERLTRCAKEIAGQVIVWYQGLPEHARVTAP